MAGSPADPGAPSVLAGRVRLARRRWGVMRAAESALFGLAAAVLTVAAASLSGGAPLHRHALAAAAVSGALAAATWWMERRRTPRQIARRIDGGLGRGGDFLTAFEREGAVRNRLERTLVTRVAREVDPAAVRRTVRPPSVALLAVPLVAAALLVLALDLAERRGGRAGPHLWNLAVELGRAAGEGDPGADPELAAWAETALALAEQPPPPADLARELERIRTGLEAPGRSEAELGRARDLVQRLLAELGGSPAVAAALAPGEPARSGPVGLAESGEGRTMTGSPSLAEGAGGGSVSAPEGVAAAPPVSPEAGVLAGRWWDERYDAIVSGWREARERRESP